MVTLLRSDIGKCVLPRMPIEGNVAIHRVAPLSRQGAENAQLLLGRIRGGLLRDIVASSDAAHRSRLTPEIILTT
jgi:hypothetical protein